MLLAIELLQWLLGPDQLYNLDMHLEWAMALQWALYFNLLYLLLGGSRFRTDSAFAYAATASGIGYEMGCNAYRTGGSA